MQSSFSTHRRVTFRGQRLTPRGAVLEMAATLRHAQADMQAVLDAFPEPFTPGECVFHDGRHVHAGRPPLQDAIRQLSESVRELDATAADMPAS